MRWIGLDLDQIPDDTSMLRIVEAADRWQGFACTTWSHRPEAGVYKMRLIFALDREVNRDEYARVCRGVAALLAAEGEVEVQIDPACCRPEQALFGRRKGAMAWSFDGAPVRVDEALAAAPGDAVAQTEGAAQAPLVGHPDRERMLSALAVLDPSYPRDRWLQVAMALKAGGALYEDFLDWSRRGSNFFGDDDCAEVWRSIKPEGGIGVGTLFHLAREQGWRDPAERAVIGSDTYLAALFAKGHAGQFRWSPGPDWMVNLGTHWRRDGTLARYTAAKRLCARMSRAPSVPDKARAKIASAATVSAVLTLARAEPEIVTLDDAWDRDPMVLNTPAGPFDLTTGGPLGDGHGMLFTQITAAPPDARQRTPNWLRFVSEIFCNDLEMVEFLQRLMGYCLSGDRREQILPFFYGTGANGKSVLVDLALEVMGSYALNLPSEVLMRRPHSAHPTELAQLWGKRLAVSSELEDGAYWAESRIKSLTGDATLTARYMRQDFFEFRQTQKHIVVGNFKPRLKGDDPAIVRRMVLVPFTEKFTGHRRDPLLPQKLRGEYPGILAWMIDGARKWARDGLAIPQKVRDASAEYLSANDDISLWIEDCCILGPMHRTPKADLYKSFQAWKEANGEHPQSINPWSTRMAQRFNPYRDMRARGFEGIALRDRVAAAYRYATGGA